MQSIPKEIHLIWVGGPMPQRNFDCVSSHSKVNGDWSVTLWIDPEQLLTAERRRVAANYYKGKNKRLGREEKVLGYQWERVARRVGGSGGKADTVHYLKKYFDIDEEDMRKKAGAALRDLREKAARAGCSLRNIREVVSDKALLLYESEMLSRGTNFGAASDICRIEILDRVGGVYLDTDVESVQPFGKIKAHKAHPRFSTVHPAWNPPNTITKNSWDSRLFWEDASFQSPPQISNSIIASHPNCEGLWNYKKLIESNYAALKTGSTTKKLYEENIRTSTIRMTGPTAARNSSGYDKVQKKSHDKILAVGAKNMAKQDKAIAKECISLRDNWWFPMYLVKDKYFHDWL